MMRWPAMDREPAFICDAMLGGLARWLRAAGYSARFDVQIRDGELVRRALEEGHCLLTSDSGILERYAVSEGLVQCVFIPLGLSPLEQLAHVLASLGLPIGAPRCMVCDGQLESVPLAQVRDRVPTKVRQARDRFFRCRGCDKVYWHGTHWERIEERLAHAAELAAQGHDAAQGADG